MKTGSRSLAVLLMFVIAAAATWAVEPSTEIGPVAAWLAAQSATDRAMMPGSQEFVPPPQVTISDRDGLKTVSVDAARTPFERLAALALLTSDDAERNVAIRAFFKETHARIEPYHVHPVGWYLTALQPQAAKETQGKSKPAPPPRPFGRFVAADLPLLVRMAMLESDGMAMAALGLVGDERAAEVLVHAPFVALGDRGICNANYQGLMFLCQEPESRNWVRRYLAKQELSGPRKAMVVLALAAVREPVTSAALAGLVQALTVPPGFEGNPLCRAHDLQHPILPPLIDTDDVLDICGAWGEPTLGNALAEFIYSGGYAMAEKAIVAARACGVALAKPRLMALAARPQRYWDSNAVLAALTPLLAADDAPQIASLLAPAEWSDEAFHTRVLWLAEVPGAVLTPEVREALVAVAQQYPNPPVRDWAIQSLGRFPGPEAERVLRQAEAHGSTTALRILCEREPDPYAAFLRRLADPNGSVREAAYGWVQAEWNQVPKWLDPERRAVVLKHLLADWPEADAPPERVETAMQRLYTLVVDAPLRQSAQWQPELAAAVVRRAEQVLSTEGGNRHTTRLLGALDWAHTAEARKVVEQLVQSQGDAGLREAALKVLQAWKDSRNPASRE